MIVVPNANQKPGWMSWLPAGKKTLMGAPGFATLYNLTATLRDLSILGVIAVGETFVLIGGGIDLSVGSVLLIAGISVDGMIRLGGINATVAVPIAIGAFRKPMIPDIIAREIAQTPRGEVTVTTLLSASLP